MWTALRSRGWCACWRKSCMRINICAAVGCPQKSMYFEQTFARGFPVLPRAWHTRHPTSFVDNSLHGKVKHRYIAPQHPALLYRLQQAALKDLQSILSHASSQRGADSDSQPVVAASVVKAQARALLVWFCLNTLHCPASLCVRFSDDLVVRTRSDARNTCARLCPHRSAAMSNVLRAACLITPSLELAMMLKPFFLCPLSTYRRLRA